MRIQKLYKFITKLKKYINQKDHTHIWEKLDNQIIID